ncbi:MAG: hypothetical protein EBX69_07055 [Betaproteobacteria bacterium]|nr:hypothetical protein [Betaproteobacteria bacterium]
MDFQLREHFCLAQRLLLPCLCRLVGRVKALPELIGRVDQGESAAEGCYRDQADDEDGARPLNGIEYNSHDTNSKGVDHPCSLEQIMFKNNRLHQSFVVF